MNSWTERMATMPKCGAFDLRTERKKRIPLSSACRTCAEERNWERENPEEE
jgi:hypothetical protein